MPLARSNAEAHLYMDRTPCGCGETRFERQSAVVRRGADLCSQYTGTCPACGTIRTFVFKLPEEILGLAPEVVCFGDDRPSQLLDAGEWLAIADERARRHPAGARGAEARADLQYAIAALEEVLKFARGGERVPDDAFWTAPGRAVRDAEPGRFRRARLEAVLGAYRGLLEGMS